MRRWEAWWNHLALAAVSLSGLAYGIFKYFVPSPDPDSRAGHPWQPVLLKAHVLAAPLAVFGVGLLRRRHALRKLRNGDEEGRRSGALLVWLFAPLVLTGYLIQVVAGSDGARVTGWTHAGLALIVVVAYALHPKHAPRTESNGPEPRI
jgi:hypothetical protein